MRGSFGSGFWIPGTGIRMILDNNLLNRRDTGISNKVPNRVLVKMFASRWATLIVIYGFLTAVRANDALEAAADATATAENDDESIESINVGTMDASQYTAYLEETMELLRGEDDRLFPWGVTDDTLDVQLEQCPDALPFAISILCSAASESSTQSEDATERKKKMALAATVSAWCLTDSPVNRVLFGTYNTTIFESVVRLLEVESGRNNYDNDTLQVVAAAGHLIWIAVYGNSVNHDAFVQAGAVPALGHAIVSLSLDHEAMVAAKAPKDENGNFQPVAIMFAAAALQNLAASYCGSAVVVNGTILSIEELGEDFDGEQDDPCCYWDWELVNNNKNNNNNTHRLAIASDSGRVQIDGSSVRHAMLQIPHLVDRLMEWSCRGPVYGDMMDATNPWIGENAVAGSVELQHEAKASIVPWAAAGALKNLLLEESARVLVAPKTACFCWLGESPDWLEANKAEGVLHHMRPWNPCWFGGHPHIDSEEEEGSVLCVDSSLEFHVVVGESNYSCEEMLSPELCRTSADATTGALATDVCCACGGGVADRTSANSQRVAAAFREKADEEEL